MKKKPKVKKGSSLVVVLLVFSILTILGISMLSLTVMSYKKRSVETKIKSNLYMSESGLAEAYSIIGKYVDKAFEEGSENVENELAILLDEEKLKLANGEISQYINTDGSVNEDEIEAFKREKFTIEYKEYIKDKIVELKADLNAEINYSELKVNSTTSEKPTISIIEDKSSTDFISDEYNLTLQSTFNLENLKKTIQTTYVIKVPEYSNAAHSANEIIRLTKNPVWAKAICADGDMKIQNGTVNVKGDIYIKGNESVDDKKDAGIILQSATANLIVKGNVATAGNLQTDYNIDKNKGEGSKIEVDGNIFAKNVIIPKKETEDYGAMGSSINIIDSSDLKSDGNLYVMDDMEVNAENSKVNISGGFYGISDGSQAANNNPDNSSSIIVNAEDIGENNGSKIEIGKEAYIAGSAYISGLTYEDKEYKYQTGESVSIKGNYRAYTQPLTNDNHNIVKSEEQINLKNDVKFNYFDPLNLISKYRYFTNEDVSVFIENANADTGTTALGVYFSATGKTNNPLVDKYRICYEDILDNKFIWTEPTSLDSPVEIPMLIEDKTKIKLELLDGNNSLESIKDITVQDYKELSIFDKSIYFKAYYTDYGADGELNLGRGITIKDVKNSIYLASIFSMDTDGSPKILPYNYDDIDKEHYKKIQIKRNELKNQLFYMGFYSEFEGNSSIEDIPDGIKSPEKTIKDHVDDKGDAVEGQVDFNASIFNDTVRQGITESKVDVSKDIILLNKEGSKSYAFIEDGANEVGIPDTNIEKIYYKPSPSGTTFNGIIVTKGDLYLSGNINFIGTIICGGTIYFTDTTEKNFKYDELYLNNLISNNYSIFENVFVNPLSSKNDIYVDAFHGKRTLEERSSLEMRDWVLIK